MRYTPEGRQLCAGNLDTCTNLAGYKETRNGKRRYHRLCDSHRRSGHEPRGFINHRSKRYIPLDSCQVCGSKETLERHRIKKGLDYRPKNVLVLCQPHHQFAHKLEKLINAKQYYIKRKYTLSK